MSPSHHQTPSYKLFFHPVLNPKPPKDILVLSASIFLPYLPNIRTKKSLSSWQESTLKKHIKNHTRTIPFAGQKFLDLFKQIQCVVLANTQEEKTLLQSASPLLWGEGTVPVVFTPRKQYSRHFASALYTAHLHERIGTNHPTLSDLMAQSRIAFISAPSKEGKDDNEVQAFNQSIHQAKGHYLSGFLCNPDKNLINRESEAYLNAWLEYKHFKISVLPFTAPCRWRDDKGEEEYQSRCTEPLSADQKSGALDNLLQAPHWIFSYECYKQLDGMYRIVMIPPQAYRQDKSFHPDTGNWSFKVKNVLDNELDRVTISDYKITHDTQQAGCLVVTPPNNTTPQKLPLFSRHLPDYLPEKGKNFNEARLRFRLYQDQASILLGNPKSVQKLITCLKYGKDLSDYENIFERIFKSGDKDRRIIYGQLRSSTQQNKRKELISMIDQDLGNINPAQWNLQHLLKRLNLKRLNLKCLPRGEDVWLLRVLISVIEAAPNEELESIKTRVNEISDQLIKQELFTGGPNLKTFDGVCDYFGFPGREMQQTLLNCIHRLPDRGRKKLSTALWERLLGTIQYHLLFGYSQQIETLESLKDPKKGPVVQFLSENLLSPMLEKQNNLQPSSQQTVAEAGSSSASGNRSTLFSRAKLPKGEQGYSQQEPPSPHRNRR